VAQEVFLRVYRHLESFDRSRQLRPWLLGFVRRVAAEHRRLAWHRRELIGLPRSLEDEQQVAASVEEELSAAERRALLEDALNKLSPEKQVVLRLYALESQQMSTIAAVLEIPLHTAYSRLRHGRRELRKALGGPAGTRA
jgi:RNA polymerase sigma-70 factor (ECF subfamily)